MVMGGEHRQEGWELSSIRAVKYVPTAACSQRRSDRFVRTRVPDVNFFFMRRRWNTFTSSHLLPHSQPALVTLYTQYPTVTTRGKNDVVRVETTRGAVSTASARMKYSVSAQDRDWGERAPVSGRSDNCTNLWLALGRRLDLHIPCRAPG